MLADFRAWERSATASVVHVMQIERGNGAAANRLTFTDKPYYDKGVAGVKYHQTYPAPHHCILSDIVSDERRDGTSFDDVLISNVDGRYDGLAGSTNIIGQPFVILRGDQDWSLMEDELPYRFVEIMRGNVLGVESEEAGSIIRIRIGPVRYDLDIRVGDESNPKGFGQVFNAPLVLVSSGTNQYRFNTFTMRSSSADFELYDNGELLVNGVDYTVVTTGGFFYGTVNLTLPPVGTLTASYNLDYSRSADALSNVRYIINGAVDTSSNFPITESADLSAQGDVWNMIEGESAFYVVDNLGTGMGAGLVKRWTMTPGNLASKATTGATKNLYTLCTMTAIGDIHVSAGETEMYVAGRDGSTRKVCLLNFGTPGDVTTLTLDSSKTVTGLTANLSGIRVNSSGTTIILMTFAGILYQYSLTAGDVSTMAATGDELDCRQFDRQAWDFDIANSGRYLYVSGGSNGQIWQLELPTPFDLGEWVYLGRADNNTDNVSYLDPFYLHVGDDNLYVLNGSYFINRTPLTDGDWMMPRNPVDSNLYTTDCEIWAGVHAASLMPYGEIITNLAASLNCTYCIDRLGTIRLLQIHDPEAAETFEPIAPVFFSDFLGSRSDYIQQTGTDLPARTVGLSYQRNVVTQSESELAGALTQDEKYEFSTPVRTYTDTNALASYERSDDAYIDAYTASNGSYPLAMLTRLKDLRAVSRYTYDLTLHLRAITLTLNWTVGNVIEVQDDWQHTDFSAGDKLLCIGRHINWSKHQQTLTVFK